MAKDLCEVLEGEPLEMLKSTKSGKRIAYHSPCSLQHGQQLAGRVEAVLGRLGFDLTPVADSHLCCGSAGTYSILQPELSQQLLKNKLAVLEKDDPDQIVTANVGCQLHLGGCASRPVRHWIELVEEALR